MKQPAFVFGVSLLAACATHPKHPLCSADGSPACGNIGQVGRTAPVIHPVIGVSAAVVPAPEQHGWIAPAANPGVAIVPAPGQHTWIAPSANHGTTTRQPRARPLLSPGPQTRITVDHPLLTRDERPASGNVMGKSAGRSRYNVELAQPVDATATPAPELATMEQHHERPLLTRELRPATGNMHDKRPGECDDARATATVLAGAD